MDFSIPRISLSPEGPLIENDRKIESDLNVFLPTINTTNLKSQKVISRLFNVEQEHSNNLFRPIQENSKSPNDFSFAPMSLPPPLIPRTALMPQQMLIPSCRSEGVAMLQQVLIPSCRSEGVAMPTGLIKECGAAGNCFVYSLLDQLNGLQPRRNHFLTTKELRECVSNYIREHEEEILANEGLIGQIRSDVMDDPESRKSVNHDSGSDREFLEYYKDYVAQDRNYLDKAFAHLFTLANTPNFQIALVQKNSDQDRRCNIVAVFPSDRPIDSKNTIFIYHTGSHRGRAAFHYQSINRINPQLLQRTVRELIIARDYQDVPDFRSRNNPGKEVIPENPILFCEQIMQLEHRGKTHDAICLVAYDNNTPVDPETPEKTDNEKLEEFKRFMRDQADCAGFALIDAILTNREDVLKKIDDLYETQDPQPVDADTDSSSSPTDAESVSPSSLDFFPDEQDLSPRDRRQQDFLPKGLLSALLEFHPKKQQIDARTDDPFDPERIQKKSRS